MAAPRHRRALGSRVSLWLTLFAFGILSLLPAHVMPKRTPAGAFVVVLCADGGPVELALDPVTGQPVPVEHVDRCPYAVATAAFDLPLPAPALARPAGAVVRRNLPPLSIPLVARQPALLPLPRGPPRMI